MYCFVPFSRNILTFCLNFERKLLVYFSELFLRLRVGLQPAGAHLKIHVTQKLRKDWSNSFLPPHANFLNLQFENVLMESFRKVVLIDP